MTAVEIPSQTTKRFWLYAPPRAGGGDMRLLLRNRRGKIVHEAPLKMEVHPVPTRLVAESIPSGWLKMGLHNSRTVKSRPPWQSTRILKQHLPDDVLGYDALTALHLGWSDLSDLQPEQRQALLDWVWSGGHLIVSTEDFAMWRSDPWWAGILPLEVTGQKTAPDLAALGTWLDARRNADAAVRVEEGIEAEKSNGPPPPAAMETVVGEAEPRDGRVLMPMPGLPWISRARLGRGMVTQVLFNPGREPFRGWEGRGDFWLHLLQETREAMDTTLVPKANPATGAQANKFTWNHGSRYPQSWMADNFGASLLNTRQQRSLPWVFLGLLLMGYLVLIGPFDYTWLKRRRKLVWTWVTFPSYVVGTTALIYLLGNWVNTGESEWRQWTVLDWFPATKRQNATTMAMYYSTRNGHYAWRDSRPIVSHVREMGDASGRIENMDSSDIISTPAGCEVNAPVPVWTSRGFVGRFSQAAPAMEASYDSATDTLTMTNPTQLPWRECRWVTGPRTYKALGDLGPGERKTWKISDVHSADLPPDPLANLSMYQYQAEDQHLSEQNDHQLMDGAEALFFAPTQNPTYETGSVNEGLDLFEGWQNGDAAFIALSDAPREWPWSLQFNARRKRHWVTHRVYFPTSQPVASAPGATVDDGE